jgi:carboxypeptidase T
MIKTRGQQPFPLVIALLLLGSSLGISGASVPPSGALRASFGNAGQEVPAGHGPWVVRAYYTDRHMVDELAAWVEPWEVHHDKGYLVVAVAPEDYARLLEAGFYLEVDEQLTAELNKPRAMPQGQVSGIPGYPCYRTVEETYAAAQAIAAAHPGLASWIDVADSWEKTQPGGSPGYDLMVLRLTNAAVPRPKPKLFVMASMHAREFAAAELATRLAEYLVDNYSIDADVTWLLDYHEIHLMLEANPDGRKLAESGAFWRKNTDNDDGCFSSNSWGTDLNRNFEFQWACCNGSSPAPCDETFRGPAAGSEPETIAVQNYLRAEFPDQRDGVLDATAPDAATGVFVDLHSYGELVLWPWGFTYSLAPNGSALQTLGRKFAFFNGYWPEQAVGLYPTDGTADDFVYGELGVAAYTFEVGTSFFQDCGTFENAILPDSLPALIYAAKVARTPYLTPAGPDAHSLEVSPAGVADGDAIHLVAAIDDTRYNDTNGTEPTQNIAAAAYTVDVPPWVSAPAPISHPMAASDGTFDQKSEEVEATIDTTGLAAGRHTVFVRGRDSAGNWGAVSAAFVYVLEPGEAPVIEGYARDAGDNHPLDAAVAAGPFHARTDPATGYYRIQVIPGVYDLSGSATGYTPATVVAVTALAHQTSRQDLALLPMCPILEDNVEAGTQGWTAQGPWAITAESAHSPSHSWTDSPGSSYSNNRNVSLTSPTVDLSGYEGISLSYWHTYDLETGYDQGLVEYSIDGGSTWVEAASYTGYGHTTWSRDAVFLPALDGQPNARIRFRLSSDINLVADGWHLDDLILSGGSLACVTPRAPTAEFASNSPGALGNPVRFVDLTTGALPLAHRWDFGDGLGTSTEPDPQYTYLSTGAFTVSLVVTNSLGTDGVEYPVTVDPCVDLTGISIDGPESGAPGIYRFTSVYTPANASPPIVYEWDDGDGTSASGRTLATGLHTLTVTATNCTSALVTDTHRVQIVAEPTWLVHLPLVSKY